MALSTKGMKEKRGGVITRRQFMKATIAGAALAGTGGLIFPRYGAAKPKTLKIMQWAHYVPGYDKWFNETYVKEWGAKNDTVVTVDNISIAAIGPPLPFGFKCGAIARGVKTGEKFAIVNYHPLDEFPRG